jgi:hypothetical protein
MPNNWRTGWSPLVSGRTTRSMRSRGTGSTTGPTRTPTVRIRAITAAEGTTSGGMRVGVSSTRTATSVPPMIAPTSPPMIAPTSPGTITAISGSTPPVPTRPDPTRPDPISGAPTAEAAVPDEPGPTKTRKKPAKPFPPDFHPSQQHIDLARELNVDLRCEFEQFRDYWISEGRPKADWDATLRNWIRKARGNVRPLPIQMNGGRPFIPLAPDDKR